MGTQRLSNFYKVVEQLQKKFDKRCVPIQLPIGAHTSFEGIVDLVAMKSYKRDSRDETEIPASAASQAQALHDKMVESVVELDDELTNKYLDGQDIAVDDLCRVLVQGIKDGKIIPILTGSALQNTGTRSLLDAVCQYLPSPKEVGPIEAVNAATQQSETLPPDEGASLAALVFLTSADPYVGKVTHFRVYSGSISSNSQAWNASKGQMERVGQLLAFRGKRQEAVPKVGAGDMGSVGKLAVTVTGDTLSAKERPLRLSSIEFPEPVYSVSLYPKTKTDVDKLGTVLPRLVEEDPTIRVRKDADTGETVLSGMGDTHVDVAAERLQRKFGVGG